MLLCCPHISHKAAHSWLSGKSWGSVGFPLLTPCFYPFLQRAESSCRSFAGRSGAVCLPVGSAPARMLQQEAAPCFVLVVWKSLLDPAARPHPRAQVTSLDSFLLLSL